MNISCKGCPVVIANAAGQARHPPFMNRNALTMPSA